MKQKHRIGKFNGNVIASQWPWLVVRDGNKSSDAKLGCDQYELAKTIMDKNNREIPAGQHRWNVYGLLHGEWQKVVEEIENGILPVGPLKPVTESVNPMMREVGKYLFGHRMDIGMSLKDVAHKGGMDERAVRAIERGELKEMILQHSLLANLYDIPLPFNKDGSPMDTLPKDRRSDSVRMFFCAYHHWKLLASERPWTVLTDNPHDAQSGHNDFDTMEEALAEANRRNETRVHYDRAQSYVFVVVGERWKKWNSSSNLPVDPGTQEPKPAMRVTPGMELLALMCQEARKKAGFEVREAAELLHSVVEIIQHLENGTLVPSALTLSQMEIAYNVKFPKREPNGSGYTTDEFKEFMRQF